jgi:GMP synthase (glutamine-hydrolysing)
MRCLVIVHQPDAGPGVFADEMRARSVETVRWEPGSQPAPALTDIDAVMTFGGAMHPDSEDGNPWLGDERALLAEALERGTPIMAVCLGAQILAGAAGGAVLRAREPEIGWYAVEVTAEGEEDPVIGPLAPGFNAFQWHSYECLPPPGAVALATSPVCLQAYRIGEAAWGIQFHAEVSPADAELWIDGYRKDPDAVRMGLDPDALRRQTAGAIGEWNRLGRGVCARFLEAVSTRA